MNAGMKNGINLLMILVLFISCVQEKEDDNVWGIERSGFFNGREKWAKGFENQRV